MIEAPNRWELIPSPSDGPFPFEGVEHVSPGPVYLGGVILSTELAKEAPPMRPSPEAFPQGHIRLPDTYFHPLIHDPPYGGKAGFPSPFPFVSEARTSQPESWRVDWRRPEALIPGSITP